jgi:hypothetical protein
LFWHSPFTLSLYLLTTFQYLNVWFEASGKCLNAKNKTIIMGIFGMIGGIIVGAIAGGFVCGNLGPFIGMLSAIPVIGPVISTSLPLCWAILIVVGFIVGLIAPF